jgi:hypothetical protein
MIKSESVTITQIAVDAKTVFGLGTDQMMYQWNFLDSTWHLFAVQREREVAPEAKTATPATPPPAV